MAGLVHKPEVWPPVRGPELHSVAAERAMHPGMQQAAPSSTAGVSARGHRSESAEVRRAMQKPSLEGRCPHVHTHTWPAGPVHYV